MSATSDTILPKLISLAIKNHKNDNLIMARDNYKKILEIKPDLMEALYNLGIIFGRLGENENAKKCYEKILQINPDIADVNNNLGLLFYEDGDHNQALIYFNKAIEIKPNYANAYNNIGLLHASEGKYEKAINNYCIALEHDHKHKNANKNLISALNYSDTDKINPIILANNKLKEINIDFSTKNFFETENLKKLFEKSKKVLDVIEKNFNFIENSETQSYRRNSINLNCERHHKVYNSLNIIPASCFNCFKILIEPKNVLDLIRLFYIFDNFNFPKNNWRKCMVELRDNVPGTYKGFIYCSSFEEATQILNELKPFLIKFIKFDIKIKRGCSEFYELYPDFDQINKNEKNYMNYNKKWKQVEEDYDSKENKLERKLVKSNSGMSILDFLIINNWINYAKNINDVSYKDICIDFYHSTFISDKLLNQIEFRKKQFTI